MKIHPGIRIDKIPVKGPVGLAFTIGVLFMFLTWRPIFLWFLGSSLAVGVVIGVVLRLTSRD